RQDAAAHAGEPVHLPEQPLCLRPGALADLPGAVQVDVGVHVPELAVPQPLLDEVVVDGDLIAPRAFQIMEHEAHRPVDDEVANVAGPDEADRKSTRLNSSHQIISYAVF